MTCGGEPAELTSCDCPAFVWGHAFGEALRDGDDEPYWQVHVTEAIRGE
ncbi:MAG: hypothetical protein AB7S26_17540 [Sandaracinaceae bacterium]